MRRFFPIAILCVLLVCVFCGKKGPVLPPIVKVPKPIEGLNQAQIGDLLVLFWRLPTAYIDGSPISEDTSVVLWYVEEERPSEGIFPVVTLDFFRENAQILGEISSKDYPSYQVNPDQNPLDLSYSYQFGLDAIGKKRFIFSLVFQDERGRYSEFSGLVAAEPVAVALSPPEIQTDMYEDKVEISWSAPDTNLDGSSPVNLVGYNIYRAQEDSKAKKLNPSVVTELKFEDRDFVFGQKYDYFVRATATSAPPFIESSDSEKITVVAKDSFAPLKPTGLVAIDGEDFVSLSWDLSRDADLANYNVWRRDLEASQYTLLTPEGVHENSYTDTEIELNQRYEYAVTAIDKQGNESQKSDSVIVFIKRGPDENI